MSPSRKIESTITKMERKWTKKFDEHDRNTKWNASICLKKLEEDRKRKFELKKNPPPFVGT